MSNLYRHEQKYICSSSQIKHLHNVLQTFLPVDSHQNGTYHIKSLYFDTIDNRCLQESLDGVAKRSKYRLRYYDKQIQKVKFECKSSLFSLKQKRFVWLNQKQAESVLSASDDSVFFSAPLLNEFYCLKKTEDMRPKIIVDYNRTAFVLENLNVRITLDQNITCSLDTKSFLSNTTSGKNILPDNVSVLEVKFDDILPRYITEILSVENLEQTAFSKYVQACLAFERKG